MMSTSTTTTSFTVTNARYLASKVAADLRQMQRLYGTPSDEMIADYLLELIILLRGGYLKSVQYGFRRNGNWILTLAYTVDATGHLTTDTRAGGVYAHADTSGATFYSYLCRTDAWFSLTPAQREAIESTLPVVRTPANEPGAEGGYWEADRSYASGGVGVVRRTYRPW